MENKTFGYCSKCHSQNPLDAKPNKWKPRALSFCKDCNKLTPHHGHACEPDLNTLQLILMGLLMIPILFFALVTAPFIVIQQKIQRRRKVRGWKLSKHQD